MTEYIFKIRENEYRIVFRITMNTDRLRLALIYKRKVTDKNITIKELRRGY